MVFDYKDQLKTGEASLSTWPSVPGASFMGAVLLITVQYIHCSVMLVLFYETNIKIAWLF